MTARKTASEKLQDEALPEVELPEAAKLKPIRTIRLRDRKSLLALVKQWMDRNKELDEKPADAGEDIAEFNDRLAEIQDALEPLALDPEAFVEWSNNAPSGLIRLFVGLAAELGDSMRSQN